MQDTATDKEGSVPSEGGLSKDYLKLKSGKTSCPHASVSTPAAMPSVATAPS
jgi:hypothetical protein